MRRPSPTQTLVLRSRYGMQLEEYSALMQNRVRSLLIVAAPYSAFVLEEDGQLTELLFQQYRELDLNMQYMPKFKQARSASEALAALDRVQPDMVVATPRLGEMGIPEFLAKVKEWRDVPTAVLATHAWELRELQGVDQETKADYVFVWQGEAQILLAMIKQVEDRLNADTDVRRGGVQVILVVEDDIRSYSQLLPRVYWDVTKQTSLLMKEGFNLPHRLLRIRARPKILLARTYEEAKWVLDRYGQELMGVITDVEFPRDGALSERAGLDLVREVRERLEDVPVLVHSTRHEFQDPAEALGAQFEPKDDPTFLDNVSRFIRTHLGFGEFVFRLPDGTEVGRAGTIREMIRVLPDIPGQSVLFHARRNHFSRWLKARCDFELAGLFRDTKADDFPDGDELKRYLAGMFRAYLREVQRHIIVDYDPTNYDEFVVFSRIGNGSLGGKGRGLAFVNKLLASRNLEIDGVHISIPQAVVLASDVFEQFMERNGLTDVLSRASELSDEEILDAIRAGRFEHELRSALGALLKYHTEPLAVRSSSILEDSLYQPFAGIYETVMLPNSHPSLDVRLAQLLEAIKVVYASTFFRNARDYLASTPHRVEEEKMAVIVQRLVGSRRGEYFYPTFSGVAASYNYYPFGGLKPEDGVALVAVGLGKSVVEGFEALRFCPRAPQVLPQFSSVEDTFRNAQREFYALDLRKADLIPGLEVDANLVRLNTVEAVRQGAAHWVVSTYLPDNDRITPGYVKGGSPLVTFSSVLKGTIFPLPKVLDRLLKVCEDGFGTPVEIEFAVDSEERSGSDLVFNVLQVRPLVSAKSAEQVTVTPGLRERALVYSDQTLGNGRSGPIRDVIFVDPDLLVRARTREAAQAVAAMDEKIRARQGHSLIVGPGRWGSRDPWLGIPVVWGNIASARAIVEMDFQDLQVEPSQGSHFFHNLTCFGVAYFHVRKSQPQTRIDLEWFRRQPAHEVAMDGVVRWIRLDRPVEAAVDGLKGEGVVVPEGVL